ncbi:hypothetical protein N431DRAFT_332840 [Stipitochalara longipes BDJ]|nr:hypothetical protein N431DRAFT_332840 [Stipitochalara longipes BDJ]
MTDIPPSQADGQPWGGGEHFFDALHDPFCFTCGYDENIIACKTCARCYHTECMFPPLEPDKVPEIYFCPVCVARGWHVPPAASVTHPPPSKFAGQPPTSTRIPSGTVNDGDQQGNMYTSEIISLPKLSLDTSAERTGVLDHPTQNRKDTQAWKDAQRFKENSWYTPRGYILDPSCGDRFIPLYGNGPSIPLSEVKNPQLEPLDEAHCTEDFAKHAQSQTAISCSIQATSQSKSRRSGKMAGNKSPPRKRYKYSDVPADVENALDLIQNHILSVSQPRKSQIDVDGKAQVLEQKLKIQEGEMFLCRQELEAVKQKLTVEASTLEIVRAENAELRKEVEELRVMGQKRENQMKNWQNLLQGVVGAEIGASV